MCCSWPEQDAVEEWFFRNSMELKEMVSEYRIKIQANIQTCLKCKRKYHAESHEYPCPWCIIEKKMDMADKAYKKLYGLLGEGADPKLEKAINGAMKLMDDIAETGYFCTESENEAK